MDSFLPNRW